MRVQPPGRMVSSRKVESTTPGRLVCSRKVEGMMLKLGLSINYQMETNKARMCELYIN